VKGRNFVVIVLAILAANVAVFFWARQSHEGCFLTRDEIAGRWGTSPVPQDGAGQEALAREFGGATPADRVRLAHALIESKRLLGKAPADAVALLGPVDGTFSTPGMPAYRLQSPPQEDGADWNLVLAVGKGEIIRDVFVWRPRCP
jgi:hypothetical protein